MPDNDKPNRCAHEPLDKPNHLCPFAALQPKSPLGDSQVFVDKYVCTRCAATIKVVTPVDSDRQWLTENELKQHGVK